MPDLTYDQRKALRRLGRGQSIGNRQYQDPVIKQFFDLPELPELPKDMDVADWVDWKTAVRNARPTINQKGRTALAALEGEPRD